MNVPSAPSRREAIVERLRWVDDTHRRLRDSARRAPWALADLDRPLREKKPWRVQGKALRW